MMHDVTDPLVICREIKSGGGAELKESCCLLGQTLIGVGDLFVPWST